MPVALLFLSDITWESVAAGPIITSAILFAKTLHTLGRCDDVMTFESLTLMSFC